MVTYNIFDDVLKLRNLVDDFFTEIPYRTRTREFPYVEMNEGKDEIVIRALVPGIKAEELKLELVDTSLMIEGEKKNDYADHPYIRKERQFGVFKKAVKLPYAVDGNAIKAELNNGILTIRLVKAEEAKPRRIQIN